MAEGIEARLAAADEGAEAEAEPAARSCSRSRAPTRTTSAEKIVKIREIAE